VHRRLCGRIAVRGAQAGFGGPQPPVGLPVDQEVAAELVGDLPGEVAVLLGVRDALDERDQRRYLRVEPCRRGFERLARER
jgi:hypothetical protein